MYHKGDAFVKPIKLNGISVVAACKGRTHEQIVQAIAAGIKIIGQNYVQEAEDVFPKVDLPADWHFIGHLQKNKVKRALKIFSCIQSVDSFALAEEIDRQAGVIGKTVSVLIEVNVGGEKSKFGVAPEKAQEVITQISPLKNVKVNGLMAMEPPSENPEDARPYFKQMKQLFDGIKKSNIPNVEMRFLSMGMSSSYRVAIEEGSNMVRLGRVLFE
ncbi:YggS family pyridoxal phosphate-dependent enzyme [Candidatus Micrarchaeota archaeon CG08_land_8_20_14_0_20_49_17]|nr:MAG: YggS family pyridoxal phosphate enzyme [Candidatus Micrarchaeota archaeon CG1_02_49_24]PIU09582.1 MAG: YggS family pyridoxal phosphate-dependent enzyme [Candidatus Micrarchaeota archaeon CG08_land_8_20_14_0_20_49_17]PIU81149.1 MAG: YggS family pyridoxal phosphate-dependent enzyme [Candidatus Micrarchaeota archaeon CG06_land_8_20_14_3_00_50_6]HII54002.1 YggS family pyridoxal phosphate-dependent enzyme [Candidatus Micrarchaeota archaeon]